MYRPRFLVGDHWMNVAPVRQAMAEIVEASNQFPIRVFFLLLVRTLGIKKAQMPSICIFNLPIRDTAIPFNVRTDL